MTLNCAPPVGATAAERRAYADQWFPDFRAERTAKVLCHGCSAKEACLAEALATESPRHRHGIRGGLMPKERAKLMGSAR